MVNRLAQVFSRLSLRNKLMTIVVATSSFVLVLTCGAFMIYNTIETRNAMVRQLDMLASLLGNRSAAALIFLDQDQAAQNLRALTINPSIMFACMYDADGREFAVYRRRDMQKAVCPKDPAIGHQFFSHALSMHQEIIFSNNERLGSIYIQSDLRVIQAQLLQYGLYVLIFMLIGNIIAFFVSRRLQRMVTRPIESLVETARDVKDYHRYSVRAVKTTEDDLGVLVDTFNDMLTHIQDNEKALQNANEALELRVIERTRDLETAKQQAENANLAKSQFLANMSHELRTPMHAILSFANFGIDEIHEPDVEEKLKYFTRIRDSGSRLLSLLNNLLDLSKLEAGKMEFTLKKEDMQKAVRLVLSELQSLIAEKQVVVEVVPPESETTAVFDYGKIIQVIYNLASNAIKFTPKGKKITLRLAPSELTLTDGISVKGLAFEISDEGFGIPEDELDSVFDKFIQSSKTKTGAGGTGLGLAICREIINEHKGRIWAENVPSGGAKFTFVLPIEPILQQEDNQKVTDHAGAEKTIRTVA